MYRNKRRLAAVRITNVDAPENDCDHRHGVHHLVSVEKKEQPEVIKLKEKRRVAMGVVKPYTRRVYSRTAGKHSYRQVLAQHAYASDQKRKPLARHESAVYKKIVLSSV